MVLYDAQRDLAVLDVPDLTAPALRLRLRGTPKPGADAIVAGYPLDGPYTAHAGPDPGAIQLRGPEHLRQRHGHP